MENISIEYQFQFDRQPPQSIKIELDPENLSMISSSAELPSSATPLPDWTRLTFHQCEHCPLDPSLHEHCPLAVQMAHITPVFESMASYDQIEARVITENRVIQQQTTVQRALSSIMGLVIATSGCPHSAFFRSMARYHLPFSSEDETLFRAVSSYLLAQYFLFKQGKQPDLQLEGLEVIYANIHKVNRSIAARLKAASQTDSSANAIILLDLNTKAIPYVISDSLDELRYLFQYYFDQEND